MNPLPQSSGTWPNRLDFERLRPRQVDIWLARWQEWAGHPSELSLSAAERKHASAYANEVARMRFAAGRGLLRQLAAGYLGAAPKDLSIEPGTYGKPGLAGSWANSPLAFNISRSGDFVAFAFTVGRSIGVDIEAMRSSRFEAEELQSMAGLFTEGEAAIIRSLPPVAARTTFFRLWVCKEACLKCDGCGLQMPLDQIPIEWLDDSRAKGRCGTEDFAIRFLEPAVDAVAAVAVKGLAIPEPRVIQLVNC